MNYFFDRWSTASGPTLPPLDRRVGQRPGHFFLAAPDRLLVQPGDLRHQHRPAMPKTVRLDGGIPPPFGLPKPTQQQVHLLVQPPIRVGFPGLAGRTLADLDLDQAPQRHPADWSSVTSS